jgi:hypothetical protein
MAQNPSFYKIPSLQKHAFLPPRLWANLSKINTFLAPKQHFFAPPQKKNIKKYFPKIIYFPKNHELNIWNASLFTCFYSWNFDTHFLILQDFGPKSTISDHSVSELGSNLPKEDPFWTKMVRFQSY